MSSLECHLCGRADFKTKRGLTQHQAKCQPSTPTHGSAFATSPPASPLLRGARSPYMSPARSMTMEDTDDFGRMDDNEDGLSDLTYPEPPNHHAFNADEAPSYSPDPVEPVMLDTYFEDSESEDTIASDDTAWQAFLAGRADRYREAFPESEGVLEEYLPPSDDGDMEDHQVNDSGASGGVYDDDYVYFSLPQEEDPQPQQGPDSLDRSMKEQFQAYCDDMGKNYIPLNANEQMSIKLLDVLATKKAPLNTHDEILMWHLHATGVLSKEETLRNANGWWSRETLVRRMKKRYNMEDKFPKEKRVHLPFSRSSVKLTLYDAKKVIQALLTDPRITDDDYLSLF